MPGDPEVAAGQAAEVPPRVAVIAALGLEIAPLAALLEGIPRAPISLHQSGSGYRRAYSAARAALQGGAVALVSWGIAGGLEPGLTAGALLLPRRVLKPGAEPRSADAEWRAALLPVLRPRFPVHEGDLLGAEEILATPRSKARAAMDSGAVAVDMESAAVADAAHEAGRAFIAFRVVADRFADTLPPDVDRWIDDAGNRRLAPALDVALKPSHWRALLSLALRYRKARQALTESAGLVAAGGFLYPQASRRHS